MKILCIASRASFLAILFAVVPGAPLPAQAIGQEPISQTPVPAIPAFQDSTPNPSQAINPSKAILDSTASPPLPVQPWYNSIFKQRLPIDFGFRIGQSHSDNIFYQTKKTDDYITEVAATLNITMGQQIPLQPTLNAETAEDARDISQANYFHLSITPTLIHYARNSSLDDVDEHADVIYSHQFARLTLSLEQSYEKLSQPTVQINAEGALIKRDIYTTTARANYAYSDKLSTYGTATQTINSYVSNIYTDYTEWQADYYFLYQLFPKLSLGVGPRLDFEDIQGEPNQDAQGALVHLAFLASGKFHVSGAVGAELREYENNVAADKVTPIVEGTATYQPFDSMTITVDGNQHRIVSSSQSGTDYTATLADFNIRQRLLQVVYFNLGAGYEKDQYQAFHGFKRDDGISFAAASLSWKSFRGVDIDLSYSYLRNDSNVKGFTFNENRVTIGAAFKY